MRTHNFAFFVSSLWALCFLFCSTRSTRAWDDGGHMLVAQIAYSRLSGVAKAKANALLKSLPDVRRNTPDGKPRAYNFVAASCWMDDVKSSSAYDELRSWHYINPPESGQARDSKKPNALTAIEDSRSTLQKSLLPNSQISAHDRAIALAILIHVVGDLHQPLHATGEDLGGNNFPVTGIPGIEYRMRRDGKSVDKAKPPTGDNAPVYQRLHAFWDSAYRYGLLQSTIGRHSKNPVVLYSLGHSARPAEAQTANIAADLVAHYLPLNDGVITEMNIEQWVSESNRIASTVVFSTPRARKPSHAYFQESHDIACRQIALAGHRLATMLNEIFQSP